MIKMILEDTQQLIDEEKSINSVVGAGDEAVNF